MGSFNCDLQLTVLQVFCNHDGPVPGGNVFLRLAMMNSTRHSGCVAASFPLTFRHHFWFNQVFVNSTEPAVVSRLLEDEPVKLELIQLSQEEIGGRLLAFYEGRVRDLVSADVLDIEPSASCPGQQPIHQILLRRASHLLDDCALTYSVSLNIRSTPHGRMHGLPSVARFPATAHPAYSDSSVAGRPTPLEPPLNLFDGPAEPNVVVLSEGVSTVPPVVSTSPQEEEEEEGEEAVTRESEPTADGWHSWETCPRRSLPSAAAVSLSPLGPHRTLLHAPLQRSATGLSMATARSPFLTSLCDRSRNCRRGGPGFTVRHADTRITERQNLCQAASRLPSNPVVQFLETSRHRAASPPPSAHRQGLERSPLRRSRQFRQRPAVNGAVHPNSGSVQLLQYEKADHNQHPAEGMSIPSSQRVLQQQEQQQVPQQPVRRRGVTFNISPPAQRKANTSGDQSEPKESALTGASCADISNGLPLLPLSVGDHSRDHERLQGTQAELQADFPASSTADNVSSSGTVHSSAVEGSSSSSSLISDGLSVSDLSDPEPSSSYLPTVTYANEQAQSCSRAHQPCSSSHHDAPSGTFSSTTVPTRQAHSFTVLPHERLTAVTAPESRYRSSASSITGLSGHSQFLLDKMHRQGRDLERMSQELQERVDLLLQMCCGHSRTKSPGGHRHPSGVDTEDLEELRSSLHSARESRRQRSAQSFHRGTVDLGNNNYWSTRLAEYTGRPHRLLFDETLEKVYSGLYERALHIS